MNKLLTAVLVAALCTPAFAQKMGGTNNNAPEIKQAIKIGDESMSLNYVSITWADGKMMQAIMDKANGARARQRVNSTAPNSPLASFKTSVACKCGDLELAAGDYEIYFTINDDCEWHLNFHADGKDKPQAMKLPLMKNEQPHKRLMMSLYAGDSTGAGCYVAFGSQFAMLSFEPTKKEG